MNYGRNVMTKGGDIKRKSFKGPKILFDLTKYSRHRDSGYQEFFCRIWFVMVRRAKNLFELSKSSRNWLFVFSRPYMWSSYLILCFYYLKKDFISNWKCSAKKVAPWKEPQKGLHSSFFLINFTRILTEHLWSTVSEYFFFIKCGFPFQQNLEQRWNFIDCV